MYTASTIVRFFNSKKDLMEYPVSNPEIAVRPGSNVELYMCRT